MYEKFVKFNQEQKLFSEKDKVLLGISGGIDSMAMLHLFLESGVSAGIAHVNFQLRGSESDEEQRFVEEFAGQNNLFFHTVNFDTREYAEEHDLSIQVAARELRYNWFEKIRREYGYDSVAVAHNKDDVAETFLINVSRGTGLKGITGIKSKQNDLIRPLLFARRVDILNYCSQNHIEFREDSSNLSTKYTRNRLRHNIIPEFEKINPRFVNTVIENIERFQSAYHIYYSAIEEMKERVVTKQEHDIKIDLEGLKNCEEKQTVLFEILSDYSFSKEVTAEIISVLDGEPGKRFYSKSHELIKDRHHLIVTSLRPKDSKRYYIDHEDSKVQHPVKLKLEIEENPQNYTIPRQPTVASLDYDKLTFPLIIRKWQQGDYFKPFGLNHYKKLSDFFIDRKYSLLDKERTWLLTSGEDIVWVIGDRMDENFKITGQTRKILKITYLPD